MKLHSLLISALDGGEWSDSPPAPLNWWLGGPQSGPGRFEEEQTALGALHVAWRSRLTSSCRGSAADSSR